MLVYFVLLAFLSFIVVAGILISGDVEGGLVGIAICGIIHLAVWIWNIYDAYKLAHEYNDAVHTTGKRPW
jgi:hypothetical protein